jgi:Tfp pilus assembly protein PilX
MADVPVFGPAESACYYFQICHHFYGYGAKTVLPAKKNAFRRFGLQTQPVFPQNRLARVSVDRRSAFNAAPSAAHVRPLRLCRRVSPVAPLALERKRCGSGGANLGRSGNLRANSAQETALRVPVVRSAAPKLSRKSRDLKGDTRRKGKNAPALTMGAA